jgi:hypothetical protein
MSYAYQDIAIYLLVPVHCCQNINVIAIVKVYRVLESEKVILTCLTSGSFSCPRKSVMMSSSSLETSGSSIGFERTVERAWRASSMRPFSTSQRGLSFVKKSPVRRIAPGRICKAKGMRHWPASELLMF